MRCRLADRIGWSRVAVVQRTTGNLRSLRDPTARETAGSADLRGPDELGACFAQLGERGDGGVASDAGCEVEQDTGA